MINKLIKAAALVAVFTGGAANATSFDFSYTFSDGQALTGSLNGTLSGSYVTGISGVSILFDNNAFTGSLLGGTFNASTNSNVFGANAPVVSTNAALNNFVFADTTDPQTVNNYFYFVNGGTPTGFGTQEVFAVNYNTNDGDLDNAAISGGTGTWSLTATPVPVPAALPLLLSGLGALAFRRRRRVADVVAA